MSAVLERPVAQGRIPLSAITPSPTNPRKHFDQVALAELADNIKRLDLLQPILVRPNGGPDKYELVAGERRWRAAKAAGLADIPATVRDLSDAEVLEIQIVENLLRKDLHELEEAEGFEKLLKCLHPDGSKYGIEDLMKKTGRSRTYVFGRLKLLHLCPEARKAFLAGEVDASRALLVARIGHHDTQRQALKDITKGLHDRGPMSYREAHEHILRTYMLVLKEAPFDIKDEQLLPKAGACGPCPKRTGNQADLFGDVKSADVCTDTKCFDDKRQAHYGKAVKALEATGKKVIAGAAAKKAFPYWDGHNDYMRNQLQGGYVLLDSSTYASGRNQEVRKLLGDDYQPILLQHPGTGAIAEVATQQAVSAAASKASRKAGGARKAASGPRQRTKTPDEIYQDRVVTEIVKKLPAQPGRQEWLMLAHNALMNMEGPDLVADVFLPLKDGKRHDFHTGDKALKAALPKMQLGDIAKVVVGCEIAQRCYGRKEAEAMAKLYKVDVAKVKKAIAEEAKAAAEKKPAKAAKK
jgi:ParB/RepB/Spo0J family partition protein